MGVLKLKDGTRVPGATAIVGQLDKPFLIKWANKIGLQGINYEEYVKDRAVEGTLIHSIVESHLTHTPTDLFSYKDETIKKAESVFFNKYMPWENSNKIELLSVEQSYVSEEYKYGGIIDCYCKLNDKYTIIDFKTSKSISEEHKLQVASYVYLLRENGIQVDQAMILNMPKDSEANKLSYYVLSEDEITNYFKLFKVLVDLYYVKKEINWEN